MEAQATATRDEQEYKSAKEKNTAEAFRKYLSDYPNGIHAVEIRGLLHEREATEAANKDAQAYNAALRTGTAKALCKYLDKHQEGIHAIKASTLAEYLRPGKTFRDCEDCPQMVVVDAGPYMMGSPPDDRWRTVNEVPPHKVTIHRPLAVGVYEVKLAEFRPFAEDAYTPHKKCWTYVNDDWKERTGNSWKNQDMSRPTNIQWCA